MKNPFFFSIHNKLSKNSGLEIVILSTLNYDTFSIGVFLFCILEEKRDRDQMDNIQ